MSLRVGALAPVLVFGLAACGGEATVAGPGGPSTAGGSSASATPTAPAGDVVVIRVMITGGRVVPGPSVHEVAKGRTVRIIVTSDQEDELHVHGYDRAVRLAAGRTPMVLEFTADQMGRFEAETHESGLQLFQLQVS